MVGLGDLPGGVFASSARAISNDGQVVVGFSNSAVGNEAFRWTQAGGMIGLGHLPGSDQSFAYATSADGSIVGGASRTVIFDGDAFIWTAADGMRNLQSVLTTEYGLGPSLVGWRLAQVWDISDDGQVIVGYGRGPSGELEGFVAQIPEPGTIWLLISAAGVIVIARRVRRVRTIPIAILCIGVSLVSG